MIEKKEEKTNVIISFIKQNELWLFSGESDGKKKWRKQGQGLRKVKPCIQIQPQEEVVLCDTDGPGMLTHLWFTGYVGHSFILRIYWDGMDYPSVEAPVSAFFGCAYDENFADRDGDYPVLNSSRILVAPGRGYNCYWEMPFRRHCRVTMENRGSKEETLYYMIEGWHGEIADTDAYFHAAYRQEHPVQKGHAYTVIDGIEGKGIFAGLSFAAGMNGNNTCWVEGEPKMYLDGDQYPTINYTGTEDYFCGSYAFGNDILLHKYQTFSGLYAGMYAILGNDSQEMYNGQQRFLLYRFHVKDPVYFQTSFRMTMDNLGWTGARYDDYTSVAYWYMEKPSRLSAGLPSDEEMIMK